MAAFSRSAAMEYLTQLWIPILVSAAAVWVASALCWMAIGHHNHDHAAIPDEQGFIEALKSWNLPPGNYGFPDFQKCKDKSIPADQKPKWGEGPMGLLRVWGPTSMGGNMLWTFLTFLVVSALIAYLGSAALRPGDSFAHVFQVLGTAGVLAYCFAGIPNDIWFQKSRRSMVLNFIDGVVFGLITGAVFAWLWPR
jgi:hypothetical protein